MAFLPKLGSEPEGPISSTRAEGYCGFQPLPAKPFLRSTDPPTGDSQ